MTIDTADQNVRCCHVVFCVTCSQLAQFHVEGWMNLWWQDDDLPAKMMKAHGASVLRCEWTATQRTTLSQTMLMDGGILWHRRAPNNTVTSVRDYDNCEWARHTVDAQRAGIDIRKADIQKWHIEDNHLNLPLNPHILFQNATHMKLLTKPKFGRMGCVYALVLCVVVLCVGFSRVLRRVL